MIIAGPLYNVWAAFITQLFSRMMGDDRRYRFWLSLFQIPTKRTPEDPAQLLGYSKEKLTKFWQLSSKLQSALLKPATFQAIFVMSLTATSWFILMHQRYLGRLHSQAIVWTILVVFKLNAFRTFQK